jgi:DNA-binding transcriptional regulator YdaS (Cro superfamily)
MPPKKLPLEADDERIIACQRAKAAAGGYRALAKLLGVSPQATHMWKIVPAERCLQLADLTGIPEWELRPDLYRPIAALRSA